MNTTPLTITTTETLNEIVARHPQALPVLRRFGLDTCCGGSLPLQTAVQHHGLALDEVVTALGAVLVEES
ncbi:MAG: DUF542 domain-containing protein [Ardenticatenaceae bacterium]|nr:DUF542 domain-containing protein [Ardenticatenaceae bacterium]